MGAKKGMKKKEKNKEKWRRREKVGWEMKGSGFGDGLRGRQGG